MGHTALNCMNDDTPHVFPSQQARIDHLEAEVARLTAVAWHMEHMDLTSAREYGELGWALFKSTRAVADQLAEALLHHIGWTGDCRCDGPMDEDCPTDTALAAYNALKETP